MAGAKAARFGIEWCYTGIYEIHIGAWLIIDNILNKATNKQKLRRWLKISLQILNQDEAYVNHCNREVNQVADCLANFARSINEGIIFHSFQWLPTHDKGPFQLENGNSLA